MRVTIFRGIPGSGKTKAASELKGKELTRGHLSYIFSADSFFTDEAGVYDFDARRLGYAHGQCLKQFTQCLHNLDEFKFYGSHDRETFNLIVDNTNITAIEIAPYAQLALAHGAALSVITLMGDTGICASRNVHGVPHEKVVSMNNNLMRETGNIPARWNHKVIPS